MCSNNCLKTDNLPPETIIWLFMSLFWHKTLLYLRPKFGSGAKFGATGTELPFLKSYCSLVPILVRNFPFWYGTSIAGTDLPFLVGNFHFW